MKTVRRLLYRDILWSVAFVGIAFLSLFFFIDFVTELEEVGRDGFTLWHAAARALLALDRAMQITAANQIATKKMSVREAESLVKKLGAEFELVSSKPKKEKSRDIKRVEEELSDLLMAQVEIAVKKRVKRAGRMEEMGEIIIQFGSLDELNGLIERLSPGAQR